MNKPKIKSFKELDLLDRFLFNEVMEDIKACQAVIELILEQDIPNIINNETEKEYIKSPGKRTARIDVYAIDEDNNIYDTEMQQFDTRNIPKRSRYYQSHMDVDLLEPGEIDFNKLNDIYIIVISPFDLFGDGLYKYTFTARCKENNNIELKDGATRIFLNTKGKNDNEVNKELIELLHYVEKSDETKISKSNKKLNIIHERVCKIKASEEIGVKYLQDWEAKIMIKEEGREEGEERLSLLNRELINAGKVEELIRAAEDKAYRDKLFKEFGL